MMAFPDNLQPRVTGFPPSEGERPTARVALDFEHRRNGSLLLLDGWEQREADLREQVVRVLGESGYFTEIGSDVPEPDLEVIIRLAVEERIDMVAAYATGMTFFLIPSKTHSDVIVDALIRSPHTGEQWNVLLEDSIGSWMQLFLVFGAPFAWHRSVQSDVCENLFRNLAVELKERRILSAGS